MLLILDLKVPDDNYQHLTTVDELTNLLVRQVIEIWNLESTLAK
jgi:hypothetical protein